MFSECPKESYYYRREDEHSEKQQEKKRSKHVHLMSHKPEMHEMSQVINMKKWRHGKSKQKPRQHPQPDPRSFISTCLNITSYHLPEHIQ